MNIPGDVVSLLLLRENEEALLKEMDKVIKDKVL